MRSQKLDKLVKAGLKTMKKLKIQQLWTKTPEAPATAIETAATEASIADARPNTTTTDVKSGLKASHSEQKSKPPPEPLEDCPICRDPVGIPNPENIIEKWTSLHCGHRFGDVCIQTWLQDSLDRELNTPPSCPICRVTAKHPKCGHPVCKHDLETQYRLAMQMQWRDVPRHSNGRPRRRLQRREGHPLRPPPPPKRMVDTIGECRTCAANAAYEARMKRIVQQVRANERGTASSSSRSSTTERRSGIKSYIPSQIIRSRYASGSNGEPSSLMDSVERGRRTQSVFICNEGAVEITRVPRSPTPAPITESRRLSI